MIMNNTGMCESANMGSDDKMIRMDSVDDSNLSDDSVHFNEEEEESSTSDDKELRLQLGPLGRRQRGGRTVAIFEHYQRYGFR